MPRAGDIVNVDVTTEVGGFHGDTSEMFLLGDVSPEAAALVAAVRAARDAAVDVIRPGARVGDVAAAVQRVARSGGYTVVEEFGGHGIGRRMHLAPHVPFHGPGGRGPRLKTGMAFTIEPMLNVGARHIRLLDDGWTVVTADGSLSAQVEHTVLVTDGGVEVLTPAPPPGLVNAV